MVPRNVHRRGEFALWIVLAIICIPALLAILRHGCGWFDSEAAIGLVLLVAAVVLLFGPVVRSRRRPPIPRALAGPPTTRAR